MSRYPILLDPGGQTVCVRMCTSVLCVFQTSTLCQWPPGEEGRESRDRLVISVRLPITMKLTSFPCTGNGVHVTVDDLKRDQPLRVQTDKQLADSA